MCARPQAQRMDLDRSRRAHPVRARHNLLVDCRISNLVHDEQMRHKAEVQTVAAVVAQHQQKRVERVGLGPNASQDWGTARVRGRGVVVEHATLLPRYLCRQGQQGPADKRGDAFKLSAAARTNQWLGWAR
jgi:hypothetical protein